MVFQLMCRYSVHDVVTVLENGEDFLSADIYITPPDDSSSSAADSGPEDADRTIDNLSRKLLRSSAHMTVHRGNGSEDVTGEITDEEEAVNAEEYINTDEASSDMAAEAKHPRKKRKGLRPTASKDILPHKKAVLRKDQDDAVVAAAKVPATEDAESYETVPSGTRKWVKKDLKSASPEWNGIKPDFLQNNMTPCYIFDRFWDDEVIEHTVKMSNQYAQQKGKANFVVTPDEIRGVLAILLISGCVVAIS